MADWLIAVPVWGDAFRARFLGPVLDSYCEALRALGRPFRVVVHTDLPAEVVIASAQKLRAVPGFGGVECSPLKLDGDRYQTMSVAHRAALAAAKSGERVMLATADSLISRELLANAERWFGAGKSVVAITGLRVKEGEAPPGFGAGELLDWALKRLHPMSAESLYGSGRSGFPSSVLFRRGGNVVARTLHMMPFAFVNRPGLKFGMSVDWDLPAAFAREEIHVVTARDEGALIDICPAERSAPLKDGGEPFTADDVVESVAKGKSLPVHRWFFSHRCVLQGEDVDCGDIELAARMQAAFA